MHSGERSGLRNVYLYVVCLVTMIIVIFSTVSVVRDIVQLLYPDPGYGGYAVPAVGAPSPQSAQDLADQRRRADDSQRRQSVLGLVGSGTALLVAGPLYLYHWRRVQQELPAASGSAAGEPPPPGA